MQALAPVTFEYVPEGQLVHTADEVAPDTLEYVPAGQLEQLLAPGPFEYHPAVQLLHVLAPATSEYVPAEQLEQYAAESRANLPTSHCTQVEAMRTEPVGHLHNDESSSNCSIDGLH